MNKERAYKLLNIDKKELLNKIKLRKKYLKACLVSHPDKSKNNTNDKFIEINDAYKYLNDTMDNINTSPLFYINDEYIYFMYTIVKNIYEPLYNHMYILKTYVFTVNLSQLLNKELYFLSEYNLYIPLWHNELLFETLNLKIKINVTHPQHIIIDEYNNLNVYLDLSKKNINELIKINIEHLEFSFNHVSNKKIFKCMGIPRINYNNIYDYSTISDVIIFF